MLTLLRLPFQPVSGLQSVPRAGFAVAMLTLLRLHLSFGVSQGLRPSRTTALLITPVTAQINLIDFCTPQVYMCRSRVGIGPTLLGTEPYDVTCSRSERFKSVNDECL